MTGYEEYNFPAFNTAAKHLRDQGHVVFNPAENDLVRYGEDFLLHPERFNLRETALDDLLWIARYAEAIVVLPGWDKTRPTSGVRAEIAVAGWLGLEVIFLD